MELLNWALHLLGFSAVSLADLTDFVRQYGYGLLFLGTLFEGEAIVLIAGALAHAGVLDLGLVILTTWVGSTLNDQILYQLGQRYGQRLMRHLPRFLSRYVDRTERLIRRFGDGITLIFRFVYGTRTLTPILLGMHRYPWRRYLWMNPLAALVWGSLVASLGYLLGASLPWLLHLLREAQLGLLILIVVLALGVGLWRWRRKPNS